MTTHLRVGSFRGCDMVRDLDEDARYEDVETTNELSAATCQTCLFLYSRYAPATNQKTSDDH